MHGSRRTDTNAYQSPPPRAISQCVVSAQPEAARDSCNSKANSAIWRRNFTRCGWQFKNIESGLPRCVSHSCLSLLLLLLSDLSETNSGSPTNTISHGPPQSSPRLSPAISMSAADDTGAKTDLKVSSQPSSLKDVSTGAAELAQAAPLPTYEHEKRLVLKFDLRILPVLAFMYLCNSLDKGMA